MYFLLRPVGRPRAVATNCFQISVAACAAGPLICLFFTPSSLSEVGDPTCRHTSSVYFYASLPCHRSTNAGRKKSAGGRPGVVTLRAHLLGCDQGADFIPPFVFWSHPGVFRCVSRAWATAGKPPCVCLPVWRVVFFANLCGLVRSTLLLSSHFALWSWLSIKGGGVTTAGRTQHQFARVTGLCVCAPPPGPATTALCLYNFRV